MSISRIAKAARSAHRQFERVAFKIDLRNNHVAGNRRSFLIPVGISPRGAVSRWAPTSTYWMRP